MMTSKEIQSKLKFVKHTEKTIKLLNNLQKAFSELHRHNSVIMNTLISETSLTTIFTMPSKIKLNGSKRELKINLPGEPRLAVYTLEYLRR